MPSQAGEVLGTFRKTHPLCPEIVSGGVTATSASSATTAPSWEGAAETAFPYAAIHLGHAG